MFQTKVVEKLETHFVFGNFSFENRAIYEVLWTNTVERGRPQMTIRRMRISCWIPKVTNKHNYCFSSATIITRTTLSVTLLRAFSLLFPILAFFPCSKFVPLLTTHRAMIKCE